MLFIQVHHRLLLLWTTDNNTNDNESLVQLYLLVKNQTYGTARRGRSEAVDNSSVGDLPGTRESSTMCCALR